MSYDIHRLTAYNRGTPKTHNYGWATNYDDGIFILERKMLNEGGKRIAFPPFEMFYQALQVKGQLWYEDIRTLIPKFTLPLQFIRQNSDPNIKIAPRNTISKLVYWLNHRNTSFLVFGYSLNKQTSTWEQNLWVIDLSDNHTNKNTLLDTTDNYSIYMGYTLDESESYLWCNKYLEVSSLSLRG